jgi:flagellar hook assembly protein FlgD
VYGRAVRTLLRQRLEAGYHTTVWDGSDANSFPVASGAYFVRMKFKESSSIGRILLLK